MFRAVALSFILPIAAFTQQLQMIDSRIPVLFPDSTGNVSFILTLKSTATGPAVAQKLSLTDFEHQGSHQYPLQTSSVFDGVGGALPKEIGPAGVSVKITVSHLWEAGESTATLRNGTDPVLDSSGKILELHALRIPATYNVQFEAANPEVLISPDQNVRRVLHLVNHDSMTYVFNWQLAPDGLAPVNGSQPLVLPANGKVDLDIASGGITPGWLDAGTLRDGNLTANLNLYPGFVTSLPVPPQSFVALPLKLRLHFWSSPWQEIGTFMSTLALLIIGASASLFFRVYIPNAVGAVRLRRQLDAMQLKIEGTGSDLPSHWRVLLLGYVKGGTRGLHEMFWFFPAFTTRLAELQTAANMYAQWVEIGYAVSVVLGETAKASQLGLAPTLRDMITRKCDEALKPIATGFTTPDELRAMNAALLIGAGYAESAQTNTVIADLDVTIKAREDALGDVSDLQQSYARFKCMLEQWKKLKGATVSYYQRDTFSLKAYLLLQFSELSKRLCCLPVAPEAVPVEPKADPAKPAVDPCKQPGSAGERLMSHRDKLFAYLDTDSYQSLHIAQLLLTEMSQDFYPEALLCEAKKSAAEIHAAPCERTLANNAEEPPVKLQAEVPVRFALRFERAALNEIAALQEWTCYWDFGDGAERDGGWDVYHMYANSGKYTVNVTLLDLAGNKIDFTKSKTVEVKSNQPSVQQAPSWKTWLFSPESRIEMARLGFALSIAVAGVYATARGKVESVGPLQGAIALIALGFGIEMVKTVLTQSGDTGKAKV